MIGLFVVFREFVRAIRYAVRTPSTQALMATTGIVLVGGTLFYSLVEGWSPLDALYFSVVTLATIGYGDLTPTTDLAKGFTIFYVLIGIGLVASTVATLATAAVQADSDRRARKSGLPASEGDQASIRPLAQRFAARHTPDAPEGPGGSRDGTNEEVGPT